MMAESFVKCRPYNDNILDNITTNQPPQKTTNRRITYKKNNLTYTNNKVWNL